MRIWERERKEGEGEREGVCVTYRPSWKWRVLHKSLPFFVLAPPIFFIFYLFSLFIFTDVFRTALQLKTGSHVGYEALLVNLFCCNICKVFGWALQSWNSEEKVFLFFYHQESRRRTISTIVFTTQSKYWMIWCDNFIHSLKLQQVLL